MNIENVISFVYVYRLSSFHKAAEVLYITQPSLTSRIKTLEKDLGVSLFNRKRKGAELTEEGKIFLPYALQLYEIYLKAKSSLHPIEENITIGSIISASTTILPNAVYQFQRKNPHLSVNVITAKTKTILDRLLNNECQVAVTEKVSHTDVICEPFYRDPISLFVQPSHHFTKKNSVITLQELALEPLICFNPTSDYWKQIEKLFLESHLTPNIVFNIDSLEAAKSAILNGIGICFLPELSLETAVSSGQLRKISIQTTSKIERELSIIYQKNSNPLLQEFANILQHKLRELQGGHVPRSI
jgi:LysR family transcriptional regulator, transcriptional activator of the cysJI operon